MAECRNRKRKRHLTTRTNPVRTNQHSGWKCYREEGHDGFCAPRPNAHQSPYGLWVRPNGEQFEQNRG